MEPSNNVLYVSERRKLSVAESFGVHLACVPDTDLAIIMDKGHPSQAG
jgi:hypothetical protein